MYFGNFVLFYMESKFIFIYCIRRVFFEITSLIFAAVYFSRFHIFRTHDLIHMQMIQNIFHESLSECMPTKA